MLTILKTLTAWALSLALFRGISSESLRKENMSLPAGAISKILYIYNSSSNYIAHLTPIFYNNKN